MPNVRLLSSIVAEISLIQFSFVVLKGPSNCSKHAVDTKGEVSGDELESSRQGSRLEGLQAAKGSDLRGINFPLRLLNSTSPVFLSSVSLRISDNRITPILSLSMLTTTVLQQILSISLKCLNVNRIKGIIFRN